jgi:hypothetical protein
MKTKLLAIMLLVGGTMFAQTRISVGVGSGGFRAGFYESSPSYASIPPCPGPNYTWIDGHWTQAYGRNYGGYQVAPGFESRYNDRDDRPGYYVRGSQQERNQGFNQGRNAGGRDRYGNR